MDKSRFPKNRKALVIIGIVLIAIVGYWVFFYHSASKDHKKSATPVTVTAATRKDIPVYLNGLGTVQAYNTVTVHSQVDGQLARVLFKEGQDVHAGDVLAKIDPRIFQAQYDQAVANKAKDQSLLENARHDLARYKELGDSISAQIRDTQQATVHQLEATVAADQASIDNTKAQLSYTTILAPINGRTGVRQVDVGNIVHPGDANGLVVLTQLEPISVVFSLPQQDLPAINAQINAGNTLSVLAIDADNITVDTGLLELVDNQIDQTTGTIRLKSTFPNTKRSLWPGGFINVRLLVSTRQNAVVIPVASIQRGPQNSYVFIYKADDSTVSIRPVKVAMTEKDDAVIDEGVQEGEQIVTDGMGKLQDGSQVTIGSAAEKSDDAPAADKKDDGDNSKKHHHKKEG